MRLSALNPGDVIEADVKGTKFRATVVAINKGLARIEPADAKRYTWRFLPASRIVKKVEAPA